MKERVEVAMGTVVAVASSSELAPSYASVTVARIECRTLNNGPCDVARRRGVPVHSRVSSWRLDNDRENGTSTSIVNHRVGCMPSAHFWAWSPLSNAISTPLHPGKREWTSSKVNCSAVASRPVSYRDPTGCAVRKALCGGCSFGRGTG